MSTPSKTYDVAIVMVVYNAIHPDCLPSVKRAMEATDLSVGIVVVDNASERIDTYKEVKAVIEDALVIQKKENAGFGRASNRGAEALKADRYFFLNPDTCLHEEGVIDTLSNFLTAYPKVGMVAPLVEYFDGRMQQTARAFPTWYMPFVQRTPYGQTRKGQAYRKDFLLEHADLSKRRLVDWVQGSAFMMDGDLFRELGGFDDRFFMYFEDVDLCRGCWEKGRPVYYLPDARVQHAYGKGSAKEQGAFKNLLKNRLAREHVKSWVKYMLKWGVKPF